MRHRLKVEQRYGPAANLIARDLKDSAILHRVPDRVAFVGGSSVLARAAQGADRPPENQSTSVLMVVES